MGLACLLISQINTNKTDRSISIFSILNADVHDLPKSDSWRDPTPLNDSNHIINIFKLYVRVGIFLFQPQEYPVHYRFLKNRNKRVAILKYLNIYTFWTSIFTIPRKNEIKKTSNNVLKGILGLSFGI